MKRILPLLVVLALGVDAYGCKAKSKDDGEDPVGGDPGGQQPGAPGDPGAGGGTPGATEAELKTNPTEALEPAAPILEAGAFTDGPVWHAGMGVLFFTTPLGQGALFRMLPDGRVLKVRDGRSEIGTQPIGNTVNPAGEIVTVEAKRVVRSPAAATTADQPTVIATTYNGVDQRPPDPLNPNAPPPPATGPGQFDTLNDVVSRSDGTLYVTDPGYFATPVANKIYRIDPAGAVQVVEAFDDVPRPNGIALSPDEKTLYVGFAAPTAGTLPFVRKYIVNDDGTLGEWTKFVDVGPVDSTPDGLAVDRAGNVYVATRAGIEVFKSTGEKWGDIPVPEKPTGLCFGGEDMKTLYVTTEGIKIWQLKMKVSGISQ